MSEMGREGSKYLEGKWPINTLSPPLVQGSRLNEKQLYNNFTVILWSFSYP